MKKKNSSLPIIIVAVLIIAAGIGFYLTQADPNTDNMPVNGGTSTDITTASTSEENSANEITNEITEDTDSSAAFDMNAADNSGSNGENLNSAENDTSAPAEDPAAQMNAEENNVMTGTDVNIEQAMSDRALGNPDAKITIEEFSSLSCPHCAHYHKTVFPQLKAEYIDTGKIYYIQSDFPLNAPAVHGAMTARCLPKMRYFGFMDLLFNNQDAWAFKPDYINYLRQNAALAGLSNQAFDACLANKDLEKAIIDKMRAQGTEHNINSTPTFLINDSKVMTGAGTFESMKQNIEAELEKLENQN